MRVNEKNPYSEAEQRIADYISEATSGTVGAGDDPVGFLIASHAMLRQEHHALRQRLRAALVQPDAVRQFSERGNHR